MSAMPKAKRVSMSGGVGGRTSGGTLIRRVLVVVGFVGYVAAGFVYWAFGGLVAVPGAWTIVLSATWLAGLWLTIRLATYRSALLCSREQIARVRSRNHASGAGPGRQGLSEDVLFVGASGYRSCSSGDGVTPARIERAPPMSSKMGTV